MPRTLPSRGSAEGILEGRMLSRFPYCAFHSVPQKIDAGPEHVKTYLRAMLPFMANDTAFMNSVVLGTRANSVTPRNFSSIPDPFSTTSTTFTNISVQMGHVDQLRRKDRRAFWIYVPAMIAYSAVHANSTLALTARLQEGPSCPACPAGSSSSAPS